jgi:regulator of protease activity HflC (stomatin/prohibitin superfamily)
MMKNKNVKLFMIWLLIFLVITTLTFLTKELTELGKNMWVMLPAYFAILILGCNLPQGFVLMPNDPPHFGIVTRLGRRLWKRHPDAGKVIRGKGIIPKDSKTTVILTEGWNWIPFRRILYGVRMINMSKRSIDLDPQTLITPDQVTTDVPIAIAYTPCQEHIINLLDLGTDDPFTVLEGMVADIAADKLRVWAINPDKNSGTPQNYEQLLSASGDAEKLLIESICNATISGDVIKGIQSGHGKWEIEHFGIYLNRLNLKDMKPHGEVYEAALKVKKEMEEREAETYEVITDVQRAAKLVEEMAKHNVTITHEVALEKVMTWKIIREANTSMSLSAIATAISKAMKGGTTS